MYVTMKKYLYNGNVYDENSFDSVNNEPDLLLFDGSEIIDACEVEEIED